MGRLLRIVGIVGAVIVLLMGIGVVAIHSLYPSSKIQALVIQEVEKTLDRKVTIEKVKLSLFPVLGLRINGLSISNTKREGFATDTAFVSIEEFLVRIKLSSLLRKRLDIATIALRKPRILVETHATGGFNFDDIAALKKDSAQPVDTAASGPATLPIPLALQKFTIEEGSIVYHDRKGGMRVDLGRIDQTIDFSIDKDLRNIITTGKLAFDDLAYQSKDIKKPIEGLSITFSHDMKIDAIEGIVDIRDIRASLQKVFVSAQGTISDFNKVPHLDLTIKTDTFSLAEILAEVPHSLVPDLAKAKAEGSAQLGVAVQGSLDSGSTLAINGAFTMKDGTIHYVDLPQSINNLNASIGFTENSLDISTLTLNIGKNPISLKARITDFKKPVVDGSLDAVVNLSELKNVIKLEKGNSLDGIVDAKIAARGEVDPAHPEKLDLKGAIGLKNVTAVTPALTKPVNINGSVDLTSKRIAQKMSLGIGASSMSIGSEIVDFLTLVMPDSTKKQPRPQLSFTIASPYLNTNEFLPKQEKADGQPQSAASTKEAMLLAAPLPGIDMKGTVTTTKLLYDDFDLTNLVMNYSCINDLMNFDVRANFFSGLFSHILRLNAANLNDLKMQSLLDIKNVEMSQIVGATKGFIPGTSPLMNEVRKLDRSLHGKATVLTDFTSHGSTATEMTKNLEGTLKISLANGRIVRGELLSNIAGAIEKFHKIGDLEFRDMSVSGRVKNEKLYIEDISIGSPKAGDWGVKGGVGFDLSLDLNLTNRLTTELSRPLVATQSRLQGAAKNAAVGLLQQYGISNTSAVTGLIDGVGVPVDKDGRVTLLLGLGGSLLKPKVAFQGFGGKVESAAPQQQSPQQQITQQIKDEIAEKKAELEAQARRKLAEEQQKAQAELERRAAEEAAKLGVGDLKVPEDVKKKATEKLKKLF